MLTQRGRLLVLVLFAPLTILSIVGLYRIEFDFNFEAFLPEDNPDIAFYRDFKENFTQGGSTVKVGIERDGSLFEPEFLEKVRRFTVCARRLPFVEGAYSLLTLKDYIYDPLQSLRLPVLDARTSKDLRADSLRIMSDLRFPGNMISYDGSMLFIQITTTSEWGQDEEEGFVKALNDLLSEFDFEDAVLAGYPVFHYHLTKYQSFEFRFFTVVGSLIMLVCMVILFQRFWGSFIAFASVIVGMLIFFGILGWSGRPVDLMGTLFPILLVIVGTSDVIHIMVKYIGELHLGKSKQEALGITFREVGMATFLTSLTTAIGFISLATSNMPPIRNFGLYAALGVLVAFGTAFLFTTAFISRFSESALMKPRTGPRPITRMLLNIDHLTKTHTTGIVVVTMVLIVICGIGASRATLNLTVSRDLPFGSKLLTDFKTIDKKVRGLNTLDIAVQVRDGYNLYELKVQRELDRIEKELHKNPLHGPLISPLIAFRIMNQAWKGPSSENYTLATSQEEFDKQYAIADRFMGKSLRSLLSEDGKEAWLFINVPDIGSERLWELNEKITALTSDNPYFRITQSGPRYIFDKHQKLLVFSLLKSLGLAVLIVSFFVALVFRNWRFVVISLIPNIIPLVVTAGAMGYLGFQVDPKIAIVFTVAFGIAVDDSIHFLSRYKMERDKGFDINTAIHNTFAESGKPIFLTSLILFFGFGSLVLSSFPPTFTIGFLLSLTLAVALAADFFLLPVLIRWLLSPGKQ